MILGRDMSRICGEREVRRRRPHELYKWADVGLSCVFLKITGDHDIQGVALGVEAQVESAPSDTGSPPDVHRCWPCGSPSRAPCATSPIRMR